MITVIIKKTIDVIVITQSIKIKVILIPCLIKILTRNNLKETTDKSSKNNIQSKKDSENY